MCVLFYLSFVYLNVYAYASEFKVYFGSSFEPGAFGLPYYRTPPVCVPAVLGARAVWRHNTKKKKDEDEKKQAGERRFCGAPNRKNRILPRTLLEICKVLVEERPLWPGKDPRHGPGTKHITFDLTGTIPKLPTHWH